MNIKIHELKKGFTLIELLIVMAIIGILAGFFSLSYITVRERARDAQRKSDIRQIQAALELYRADVRAYPGTLTFGSSFTGPSGAVYMQRLPNDPSTTPNYSYSLTATGYQLRACLENDNDTDPNISGTCSAGRPQLLVTNP